MTSTATTPERGFEISFLFLYYYSPESRRRTEVSPRMGCRLHDVLRRRFWIRSTSQQRVRVIDCCRQGPHQTLLGWKSPRLDSTPIKTTVRVTYAPSLSISPFPIHSPISVINPARTHDLFIPCLLLKHSPPRPPVPPPTRQFIILSIYDPAILLPSHAPRTRRFTYL